MNNQREFLENYAKKLGLDPLVPDTWYSVSRDHLLSVKVFILFKLILFLLIYLFHFVYLCFITFREQEAL